MVEGGELPSPRKGLRATMVGDIIYVSGGQYYSGHGGADGLTDLTEVLAWDPVAESWNTVGDLAVGRYEHAAVAVPSSLIKCANK